MSTPYLTQAYQIVFDAILAALVIDEAARKRNPINGPANVAFAKQVEKLRESTLGLNAAVERMKLANEKLAARMAEHKAFFEKRDRHG